MGNVDPHTIFTLQIKDHNYHIVDRIIHYCYTGILNTGSIVTTELELENIKQLRLCAKEYKFQGIVGLLDERLKRMIEPNTILLLIEFAKDNQLLELQEECKRMHNSYMSQVKVVNKEEVKTYKENPIMAYIPELQTPQNRTIYSFNSRKMEFTGF